MQSNLQTGHAYRENDRRNKGRDKETATQTETARDRPTNRDKDS